MINVGVTAVGGGVGQAVLRSMSYSRLQWRAVGMDTRPLAPGLYWCDEGYLVPLAAQEEAYIRRVLDIVETEHLDMLVPGLDVELEPLARHRDAFEDIGCTVVVSCEEAVRLSYDKYALYEFCRERDLPFVPTYSVGEALGLLDSVSFPMIAKPRKGKASTGARLVNSREELSNLPRKNGLIVQQYLPPPSQDQSADSSSRSLIQSDEWSVQFFVDAKGELLGHFVSVNELKEGIPWEIVPRPNPEIVEEARGIVKALAEEGLRGPVNVQGRKTDEGVAFFEVNARFTGITGVRASMGYLELDAAAHAFLNEHEKKARECLTFNAEYVSSGHIEYTTLPKSRLKNGKEEDSPERGPGHSLPSEPHSTLGNVLVTGASGYIGANLIGHLLEEERASSVYAGVRDEEQGTQILDAHSYPDNLHIETGCLPNQPWRLDAIDTVVHLAAARSAKGEKDIDFFRVNAEGTRRLVESASKSDVERLIFLSSQAVYGTRRQPPWSETMPPQPETPYGLSKWIAEQVCSNQGGKKLDTVVLRVAGVFGEGANIRWSNFPHVFAKQVHEESKLEIYGEGAQRMDLVHLRDVCEAIKEACLSKLPSSRRAVFNVGSGNPISVTDLAKIFREKAIQAGLPEPTIEYRDDQGSEWADFGMNIRRAQAHLDWVPQVSIENAVEELVRAYRC